jgi:hypothetical protein
MIQNVDHENYCMLSATSFEQGQGHDKQDSVAYQIV